jgi:methylated-DNA-[protein]-cysteine S-methyltransferase
MRTLTETDASLRYCLAETDLGVIGLAWSARGLARLQLPEAHRDATERRLRGRARCIERARPTLAISRVATALQRYMAGERTDFSPVELDLTGVGEFHRIVYAAARGVAWGETTTYGALARQAGAPDAARAVGQAMGRNPVPVVIPCHRVLASGKRIGGFSAFGGTTTKQRLLELEGVHLGDPTSTLPGLLPSAR